MKNTPNVPPVEPVVEALRPFVSLLVREELKRLNVLVAAVTYDREHLPPGYASPEAFAAEARRLRLDPATYKQGRGWAIPASAWEAARRDDKARRRKPASEVADPADALLVASGLRLVRGQR